MPTIAGVLPSNSRAAHARTTWVYAPSVYSLAVLAAVIFLAIIIFGVVALIVAIRRPRARWARIAGTVASLPAVMTGVALQFLDLARGARMIVLIVLAIGVAALWRIWFGSKTRND